MTHYPARTEPFDGQWVTPQQYRFLMAIETYWRGHQRAPTIRVLAPILKVSHTRVHQYCDLMRERGLLKQRSDIHGALRTMRLTTGYGSYKGDTGFIVMWEGRKNETSSHKKMEKHI
jgi:DNA-binding transcriptional MocR family regulator